MNIKKCNNLKEYFELIKNDDAEVQLLYREFLIGVTNFFRDKEAFQVLQDNVLPDLIKVKNSGDEFKVWSIGCSTGEEVYSLAILLDEATQKEGKPLNIKIFSTDMAQSHLDIASRAIYSASIASDVGPDRLKKYFIKKGENYQVTQTIRSKAIFSCHNVLKDPPFSKLDLIVCRNMLIYVDNKMQQNVFTKAHFALNKNGVLFLGASENIGKGDKLFETIDRKWKIFRNKETSSKTMDNAMQYHADNLTIGKREIKETIPFKRKSSLDNNLSDILNETLIGQFGVAGVYIDQHYNILHAVGNFKKYITLPENQFSLNLLKMLPENLAMPTKVAIRKVIRENGKVLYEGAKWRTGKEMRTISILVRSFELTSNNGTGFLIVFIQDNIEKVTARVIKNSKKSASLALLTELEDELLLTKENLQTTIEDVENSNEELQATNEELLSSNEELQSTNEELQSVNEELHTVNAEHQQKIEELYKVNNDIENLIRSTSIPTIFLDSKLCIRLFTPNIIEQFNLSDSDIGRPISHFTTKFGEKDSTHFTKNINEVIASNNPDQKEIQTNEGKWYLQRIFPFLDHSNGNKCQGVVITFVDINEIKMAQDKIQAKARELEYSNQQLSRFNKAAVGREEKMMELKEIINQQCEKLNEKPRFDLSFKEEHLAN